MSSKIHIATFGCQMNKLDSELVANELIGQGFELCEDSDQADVLVFNTCSVRQHAENRVLTCLGRLSDRKANRPGLITALIVFVSGTVVAMVPMALPSPFVVPAGWVRVFPVPVAASSTVCA